MLEEAQQRVYFGFFRLDNPGHQQDQYETALSNHITYDYADRDSNFNMSTIQKPISSSSMRHFGNY